MKLKKAEVWAIVLTAVFLAAAAGWQMGARRRVPAFTTVAVSREGTAAAVTRTPDEGEAGARRAGPSASGGVIDLNAAGPEELKTLSGVGDVLAERIVAYREENGPFRRVEELTKVNGIGMKILEDNIERLTVGTGEEAA